MDPAGSSLAPFFVKYYLDQGRNLPWRTGSATPYHFLVTEMLLRQTQVANVIKVWPEFFDKYPDLEALVRGKKDELFDLLKVLGFGNQRTNALLEASSWIIERHGGEIPQTLNDLLEIPHIGHYSARAILCFAYGHSIELVDTNFLRFFSRYFGLSVVPDIRRNKAAWKLANSLLPKDSSIISQYNYGVLDFTAVICKSRRPSCEKCPIIRSCSYAANNSLTTD